jgi:hypothetical protein
VVEPVEVEGGGGDAVLEEAPLVTPDEARQAPTGGAPQNAAPKTTLAVVPEGTPAAEEAVSGEYSLVFKPGGRQVVRSQPARAGPSEAFIGPLTHEEAVMAAVSQRLRGRVEWV